MRTVGLLDMKVLYSSMLVMDVGVHDDDGACLVLLCSVLLSIHGFGWFGCEGCCSINGGSGGFFGEAM